MKLRNGLFLFSWAAQVTAFILPLGPGAARWTTTLQKTRSGQHSRWVIGSSTRGRTVLPAKSKDRSDEDDPERDALISRNRARTDIRNFLTQRALQSFLFLLISCRDSATVKWLENKYELRNLEHFHGTGALNLTSWSEWDSLLTDLLHQPPDVTIIRVRGRGRWSEGNPYKEERAFEIEIDIDPRSLVSRILSVREQIAREWTADLDTFVVANEMILSSYHQTQEEQRRSSDPETSKKDDEVVETREVKRDPKATREDDEDETDVEGEDVDVRDLTAPYSDGSRRPAGDKIAFDRTNMKVLSNNILLNEGQESNPYRRGSFDLLCLLATQESIHRVLREYRDEERDVFYHWLRDFYVARVAKFFDGSQEYGRADDFLEELLLTAPSLKEMEDDDESNAEEKVVGLIDPLRIAEDIIAMRSEVARDWKEIVKNVPEKDHMDLRRVILAMQMGKSLVPTLVEEEESSPAVPAEEASGIISVEEGFQ